MDPVSHLEPGHINFSPVGFRHVALDLLSCADTFRPSKFSLVPYFLYCRAMELGLKAAHLESSTQLQVKGSFGHDLLASYNALPTHAKVLTTSDLDLLRQANTLYMAKAFEYMQPGDAAGAFKTFPDLDALRHLAVSLVK